MVMNMGHVLAVGVLIPSVAFAGPTYDQARVVSVQPMYETVSYTVPREQCSEQRVQTGSGGGVSPAIPLLAAVAGGALGSTIANGHHNNEAGAVIGAVLGGAAGYDVARRNAQPRYVTYGTQEVCTTVQDTHEEERVSGYQVRYQYLGQTYQTVTRNPPGDTVRVRVDVSPAF
jgi:uncharacterized protein YcfJ